MKSKAITGMMKLFLCVKDFQFQFHKDESCLQCFMSSCCFCFIFCYLFPHQLVCRCLYASHKNVELRKFIDMFETQSFFQKISCCFPRRRNSVRLIAKDRWDWGRRKNQISTKRNWAKDERIDYSWFCFHSRMKSFYHHHHLMPTRKGQTT